MRTLNVFEPLAFLHGPAHFAGFKIPIFNAAPSRPGREKRAPMQEPQARVMTPLHAGSSSHQCSAPPSFFFPGSSPVNRP